MSRDIGMHAGRKQLAIYLLPIHLLTTQKMESEKVRATEGPCEM